MTNRLEIRPHHVDGALRWGVYDTRRETFLASYGDRAEAVSFGFGYLNSLVSGMERTYDELCEQVAHLERLTKK